LEKNALASIERTPILNGINRVGRTLKIVGINPFKLNADKIISKSKKKANYEGDLPKNLEIGIRKLIDSINKESKPNTFGSLAVKTLFERTLYQRLKIEQTLAENPEIEKTSIKQPVFIIGMPRTGTTILHALMHEDAAHRSPLAWECLVPYPVPTPENFHDNEALATVTKEFDQLFKLVPDFKKKHHMEPDSPQECIGINALDFNTFQIAAQLYVPSYMKWFFNDADRLSTMRFHKRFLQYLQSGGVKAERWLLKSPIHLMRLPEIFEIYPDARIIMTHRHPSKVVASAASLVSSVRSLYSDDEDPIRTGNEHLGVWSSYFNRFLEDRKKINKEAQIIDLQFEDFVKDQLGTVKEIYKKFDWKLDAASEEKMKIFLAQNPKDKHGAHNYTLEDFGLSDSHINEQYQNYIQFLEQLKSKNNDLQE
jgi:hypothetical protein